MTQHGASRSSKPSSANRQDSLGQMAFETGIGVVILLVIILIKTGFEQTVFGEGFDLASYATLQRVLPFADNKDLPCEIVDIGGIRPEPVPFDHEEISVTPRKKLIKIVEALIKCEPIAIGLDVDCSPIHGIPITPDDARIFMSWKKAANEKNIRLYLGVQRTRGTDKDKWLPDSSLSDIAAAITVHDEYIRYHVQWVSAPNSKDRMVGMGVALAGVDLDTIDRETSTSHNLLRSALITDEWDGLQFISNIQYALTDYSRISDLKNAVVRADDDTAIYSNASKFRHKIVLIGDTNLEDRPDTFVLPLLSKEPVPGIFLHACAVITELKAPLYEFTLKGRLLVDAFLSGLVLLLVLSARIWNISHENNQQLSIDNLEILLLFVMAVLVVLIGIAILLCTRLIWTDLFLVAFVLLVHRHAHVFLNQAYKIVLAICREVLRAFKVRG